MSKLFVVTTLYQENGGRAEKHNVGVFDTIEKAQEALENAFHENCDSLGIEELNKNSFIDEVDEEGMLPSFYLCDENDEDWFCFGTIDCIELNKVYGDTDKYEDPNEETFVQVKNLAELIQKIQTNLDDNDEPTELIIKLNSNAISRKTITFADEEGKFEVFNFIDDTTQILSVDDLFDQTKTTIGKALQVGALYYVLD